MPAKSCPRCESLLELVPVRFNVKRDAALAQPCSVEAERDGYRMACEEGVEIVADLRSQRDAMRALLVDWRCNWESGRTPGSTTLAERTNAMLAGTPAPAAPYPWATLPDGSPVPLTGGRVQLGENQFIVRSQGPTVAGLTFCCLISLDGKITTTAELSEFSPAPFTLAVGQRVRVVSNLAGLGSLDLYGKDCEIVCAGSHTSRVAFPSGTEQIVINTDLMLMADSLVDADGNPDDIACLNASYTCAQREAPKAEPAPGGPGFTLPAGFGDLPAADEWQSDLAELTQACKPRKWRKFTEAEQREMPVGKPLKLKGGPVLHLYKHGADDGWHWFDATGTIQWTAHQVAQLKAREVTK